MSTGQKAYAAYVKALGGADQNGVQLAQWDVLGALDKAGWAAAESTPAQKSWWRSKTLWVNAAASALLPLLVVAKDNIELLAGVITPSTYAWVAFGLAVVNTGLRCISKTAVGK